MTMYYSTSSPLRVTFVLCIFVHAHCATDLQVEFSPRFFVFLMGSGVTECQMLAYMQYAELPPG